jgi:hypothetical protein
MTTDYTRISADPSTREECENMLRHFRELFWQEQSEEKKLKLIRQITAFQRKLTRFRINTFNRAF